MILKLNCYSMHAHTYATHVLARPVKLIYLSSILCQVVFVSYTFYDYKTI